MWNAWGRKLKWRSRMVTIEWWSAGGVTSDQCTIGSQVTKCAWSPTPVTQNWCVPFVVACDPIRARSIIFEGSRAEKLRFRGSKLHFWRKSRTKASLLSFEASFLKEVSQKSFALELRSSIFEGSLAEKLCFRASKLHFWRKSRRK